MLHLKLIGSHSGTLKNSSRSGKQIRNSASCVQQLLLTTIEKGWRQKLRQNVVVLEWGARSNAALGILVWLCSIVYIAVVHFPFTFVGGRFYVLQQTVLCTHLYIQYSRVEWFWKIKSYKFYVVPNCCRTPILNVAVQANEHILFQGKPLKMLKTNFVLLILGLKSKFSKTMQQSLHPTVLNMQMCTQ